MIFNEQFNKNNQEDIRSLVEPVANLLKSSKKINDLEIMSKLAGKVLVLDKDSKKLKFVKLSEDNNVKQFIEELKNKINELESYEFDIPDELMRTKLAEEKFKLHIDFGNINPKLRKPEHLAKKIVELFREHSSGKVVKISDDMIGHQKKLTYGDIKNIAKLVGNLLILDEEGILKLTDRQGLEGNIQGLIDALRSEGLTDEELYTYKFDIKVKDFPKLSLANEDTIRGDVDEFLSKLEILTGQANSKELEKIIKNEITGLYQLTRDEAESSFLKIQSKVKEWWEDKKSKVSYLGKGDGFFENDIFKINIRYNINQPVESFIGREKELNDLHDLIQSNLEKTTMISQMTSISGLGGIGKSELAREYISRHSQDYNGNIIWINAENYQTLTESFRKLAQDQLGISTENADGKEKDIKSIVEEVYKFFSKRKSLFVFDNAEKYRSQKEGDEGIDRFLPSLPSNADEPYVLITSRNQKWGDDIKVLSLDTFTEKEAVEFIKKALKIEGNAQEQDIAKLAETLQRFPLALQQAVAYIKTKSEELKNVGSEFKISDYLERYEEKTRELLNFQFPEDSDNTYTRTTFITWEVTLDGIRQKENGDKAIEVLNIMSYFAPENISTRMFLSVVDNNRLLSKLEKRKK